MEGRGVGGVGGGQAGVAGGGGAGVVVVAGQEGRPYTLRNATRQKLKLPSRSGTGGNCEYHYHVGQSYRHVTHTYPTTPVTHTGNTLPHGTNKVSPLSQLYLSSMEVSYTVRHTHTTNAVEQPILGLRSRRLHTFIALDWFPATDTDNTTYCTFVNSCITGSWNRETMKK